MALPSWLLSVRFIFPVATVAIDGAKNAAWLALEIMAIKYPELSEKLKNNRQAMEKACLDTNNEISEKYR